MNNLLILLDKMQEVLASLTGFLNEEQHQLSAGHINSNLLQRITDDKRALLATLSYLDEKRQSAEASLAMTAPYQGQDQLARRWQSIQQYSRQLQDTNVHNGLLLQHQLHFTEQALEVLKPHQTQAFYGLDGRGKGQATLSYKA